MTLLRELLDGKYHSGEALGKRFSISRAAIWKQVDALKGLGLEIESVHGKGYRLVTPVEMLDHDLITHALSQQGRAMLEEMQLHTSIDSTNAHALKILDTGPDQSGVVVLAEQQTDGRGRRGRQWVSPFAQNLYLSVTWKFSSGAASLQGLSLAVAVAMADALEKLGYTGIDLKWPNDLLWNNRKLAGILLEMTGDATGTCCVVVGVGLNIGMSRLQRIEIDQPWVDLCEIANATGMEEKVSRNRVAATIIDEILLMLDRFSRLGFESFSEAWRLRDRNIGKQVVLAMGDERIVGDYQGIAGDGSVILSTAQGQRHFNGGEITLRNHEHS